MFRRIFPYLAVFFMVVVDTSVIPVITSSSLIPFMALTSILAFGLFLGRTHGALLGMFGGIILDVTVCQPLGLMFALYGISGFLAGFIGRLMRRNILSTVLAPAISLFLFEIVMLLYTVISGTEFNVIFFARAGIRILINTVLVQIEYMLYTFVCKPATVRYETR